MVLEHYKTELELAQYVSKLEAQVKGYKALCERLQAQADEMRSACQWISVEDRLPLEICDFATYETTDVLVSDGETVCECTFARGGAHIGSPWRAFNDCMISSSAISHWMPLPAAPTPTNGASHD